MPVSCRANCGKNAVLKRPKTGDALCKECFYWAFESEIHYTITKGELFNRGDSVAVAASGGKDSTVLAHILKTLNERHDYGLNLMLLSIDEGITGYRDDSLETVKQNRDDYKMPLKILSYKELYGWTMDEIVAQIGRKNNCTFCGVFRRQALDRGAAMLGVKCIATGHNADDIAETVLMNVLRGDIARLKRCTAITTGSEGTIPRVKPLKYTYEKEIVMYAHYKKLVYFSTECVFAPNAYRGHARALLKDMEKIRPACIMDIIYSGETMTIKEEVSLPSQRVCVRCNFVSSQEVCKACVLLEGLNKGLPKLGIGKSSKAKKMLQEYHMKQTESSNLKEAISELDDSGGNRVTEDKNSISGLCSRKINGVTKIDSLSKNVNKCNSKNCCSRKYDKENDQTQESLSNAKVNSLLKEYGLADTTTDKVESNLETNELNIDPGDPLENSEDEQSHVDEDDTCSASCGRMGSLQIGF
ncbi:cytoplasmic tRNA 2-thiolation protein 1 [Achroia grisella]|uniref:cytoplasmic tRNA 2-thiolation protein 1 n=1 Tax=Achroia grisella TaxID=688607 RepID=UPI0027D1F168|nr:cytoplasmic tRNA 2-thiolation protein 1 [Achroia grisella]